MMTTDFYQLHFFTQAQNMIDKVYVATEVDQKNIRHKMQGDLVCITRRQVLRIKTDLSNSFTLLENQQYVRRDLEAFAARVMDRSHANTINWITNQDICFNCQTFVRDYTFEFQEQLHKMNSLNRLPQQMSQRQFSCALRTITFFFYGIEKEIRCKQDIELISERSVSTASISESQQQ